MPVLSTIRSFVPTPVRARLLRSRLVGSLVRGYAGGEQRRRHPHAPYDLHFDGRRNVGWALGGLDEAEADYIAFTGRLLKKLRPAAVWDVGANVGFWSLYFAGFEPRIEHVVAFEPDATNLKLLRRNKDTNGLDHLDVRDVALSDHEGTAMFHADAVTGSTGSLEAEQTFIATHYDRKSTAVQVRLGTVDAEIAAGTPAPDFLKIDVEGHELSLLRGAERLLTERRPSILIEVSGEHSGATVALLKERSYRLFDPATAREVHEPAFELAALPAERADELLS